MTHLFRRLAHDESGQDIIEYALLAAGISVLIIPIANLIGPALTRIYNNINTRVTAIPGS